MKKKTKKSLYVALSLLALFIVWTVLVRTIDCQAIGPQESDVGFATLNKNIHECFGVHMSLYQLTDWLGVVPISIVVAFALIGLSQWIERKKILSVDRNIITLGIFYTAVFAIFVLFEIFVINYRPILIDEVLEASYPSSTTMLAMCVMPTAMMQFKTKIKNIALKRIVIYLCATFTTFMVIARLISGVHWFTDIIGGVLISGALVMLYYTYK